jgi:CheY-like chemotaxis protein
VKKCVLIVAGEGNNNGTLKGSFETLHPDYLFMTAPNGSVALGRLFQQPIDLILAGYQLFDMAGLELTEAVREISPATRILLLIEADSPPLDDAAKALEPDGYIKKSFTPAQILHVIEQLMSEQSEAL